MAEGFYVEVGTVPLDSEKVKENKTLAPFDKRLEAQGSVQTILESQVGSDVLKKEMMYVEDVDAGRTLTESATSGKVIFGGEFPADIFGARDQKGVRHEVPVLQYVQNYGFQDKVNAIGLYSNKDVEYIVKVSNFLRSHGLPTENPNNILKLKEIAVDGVPVPIDDWKDAALTYFENVCENDPIQMEMAKEYLKQDFFEIERELQTTERLRNISKCQTKEEFEEMVGKVFKWLNVATEIRDQGILPDTTKPKAFDVENPGDIERYFLNWLPEQMGIYLARMQKLGVVNYFPHAQNWSAVGTMYDLNDVVGDPLGFPCEEEDFKYMVGLSLGALEELLYPKDGNYLSDELNLSVNKAKASLIQAYLKELGKDVSEIGYEYFADNDYVNGESVMIGVEDWKEIMTYMGQEEKLDSQTHLEEIEKKVRQDIIRKAIELQTGKEVGDRII